MIVIDITTTINSGLLSDQLRFCSHSIQAVKGSKTYRFKIITVNKAVNTKKLADV